MTRTHFNRSTEKKWAEFHSIYVPNRCCEWMVILKYLPFEMKSFYLRISWLDPRFRLGTLIGVALLTSSFDP